MPFVYVGIVALAEEQNELGLCDNVVVEMDVAQEECVMDSDNYIYHACSRPAVYFGYCR